MLPLSEALQALPQRRPGLARPSAHKDIPPILLVLDRVAVRDLPGAVARLEEALGVLARIAQYDQCYRRCLPVAAQPVRVDSADHLRQTISRAVQVDRPGLAIIARKNACLGTFFRRQPSIDPGDRLDQLRPADLL